MIPYPNIIQRTEAWEEIKRCRLTASNVSKVITPVRGDMSKSAKNYATHLVNQSKFDANPDPVKWTGNAHTDNGNERESEARQRFAELTGLAVEELGFMTTDDHFMGCSPDMMIRGANGKYVAGGEIKCPMSLTHLGYLMEGVLPDEYRPQVHFSLYVSGLPEWHFVSFFPTYPLFHIVVKPDAYTAKLANAMDDFRILYTQTAIEIDKKINAAREREMELLKLRGCV